MNPTLCQIDDDCGRPIQGGGGGLCPMHYKRYWKYGDPFHTGPSNKGGRPRKTEPVELTIRPLGRDEDGYPHGHCYFDPLPFDAVVDATSWWTGNRPTGRDRAAIANAKAICATCPLMAQCRKESRAQGLTGVVGGEYRPANRAERVTA